MAYPASMGWAVVGNGIDVTIFFTFWGLDMITKAVWITWKFRRWRTPA